MPPPGHLLPSPPPLLSTSPPLLHCFLHLLLPTLTLLLLLLAGDGSYYSLSLVLPYLASFVYTPLPFLPLDFYPRFLTYGTLFLYPSLSSPLPLPSAPSRSTSTPATPRSPPERRSDCASHFDSSSLRGRFFSLSLDVRATSSLPPPSSIPFCLASVCASSSGLVLSPPIADRISSSSESVCFSRQPVRGYTWAVSAAVVVVGNTVWVSSILIPHISLF